LTSSYSRFRQSIVDTEYHYAIPSLSKPHSNEALPGGYDDIQLLSSQYGLEPTHHYHYNSSFALENNSKSLYHQTQQVLLQSQLSYLFDGYTSYRLHQQQNQLSSTTTTSTPNQYTTQYSIEKLIKSFQNDQYLPETIANWRSPLQK
jgi:hypothetical protein